MAEDAEDAIPPLDDQHRYEVVEVMMSTVITLMRGMIDQGGGQLGGARDAVARMAMVWPLLSTASATVARQEDSYPAMVYYERVRLGVINDDFFFDGMPTRLAVMGAPIKLELPAQQMSALLFSDVMADRLTTVTKLEGALMGTPKRAKLAQTLDGLPDVSTDVPVPARLFLSRLRSMCHGLRAAHQPMVFRQCGNNRCCRIFFTGDKLSSRVCMLPADRSDLMEAKSYWTSCSSLPEYDGPDDVRFCSVACARGWQREWYRVMPDKEEWHTDDVLRERQSSSDARIVTAFDRAIQRNSKLARAMQKRKKKMRTHGSSVSKADFNREIDARVEMLNIDVGLLYASSIFARLPCRRSSLTLPGEKATWRLYAADKHRNALLRVAQIYRQHRVRAPIHDLLEMPAFLRAVRSSVTNIF